MTSGQTEPFVGLTETTPREDGNDPREDGNNPRTVAVSGNGEP